MSKNIVVFADGTGQEGGKGHNTNVYKLFNMIEGRTAQQVAFYDRGLGTGWRRVTGNAGGMGISKNICECYEFIFRRYEAGDHIYLFGFSRGAATVRSLSGFIHCFGILPSCRPELIRQAYDIYKIADRDTRNRKAEEFLGRHHTMWTRIRFLGCWDTVAALGLPFPRASAVLNQLPGFRHDFHDFTLSPSVENACHALALDDERQTFHPVLWDPEIRDYQTLDQVWFAGMHTDVGGGYLEQSLSDIPLVWLTRKAVDKGLLIYPRHKVKIIEDPDGVMHDSRGRGATRLYRRAVRAWDCARYGPAKIHQSVLERRRDRSNQDGAYRPWILDLAPGPEVEPWVRLGEQPWVRRAA